MEIIKQSNKIFINVDNKLFELFKNEMSCKYFWTQLEMNWQSFITKYEPNIKESDWIELVDFNPFFEFIFSSNSGYWISKVLDWMTTSDFQLNKETINNLEAIQQLNKNQNVKSIINKIIRKANSNYKG